MDTPRKTKLYNKLAKDYHPKQAAMMMCRYIEGLEERIRILETQTAESEAETVKTKSAKNKAITETTNIVGVEDEK